MSQHPPFKPEAVIKRLREENSQLLELIKQIDLVISSDGEFDGCSTIGGVKALLKSLRNEREENFQLKKELKTLKNKH